MMRLILCGVITALLFATSCTREYALAPAQPPAVIQDSLLTEKLSFPWEILWGPDNYIWMTERDGRISRVNPATGAVLPLLTIPEVHAESDGGLLGMALHPDFQTNPYVFVAYNYEQERSYLLKVVRYTYANGALTDPFTVIERIPASRSGRNGCRLLAGPDNSLYITTGDIADLSLPQNPQSLNGKILRISFNGAIPADNPDPSNPVWVTGLRNAQGLVFAGNKLFCSEHGADTDDEINILTPGGNYGWPDVAGLCNTPEEAPFCQSNNVKEPIVVWTPNVAVAGMDYYNHDAIPQWKNSLLVAALKGSKLIQLQLNNSQSAVNDVYDHFENKYGRIRDLCIAPAGDVYFCTSNGNNDVIVRVSAAP
jgi:glucose/arabinose dehydrogenase